MQVRFDARCTRAWNNCKVDMDEWIKDYNEERTHSGKHCFGKTPWQTMRDSIELALAKQLDRTAPIETKLAA
jgi:hypothetical protein